MIRVLPLLLALGLTGCRSQQGEGGGEAAPAEVNGARLFQRNCAACHGALGRGDGPSSSAARPANLADPAVQQRLDQAAFVAVVREGRGVMPGFARLSEAELNALYEHFRTLGTAP